MHAPIRPTPSKATEPTSKTYPSNPTEEEALQRSKDTVQIIAGTSPPEDISSSIKSPGQGVETLCAKQAHIEEDIGLKDPPVHVENTKNKLEVTQKVVATKMEDRDKIMDRVEELREILEPIDKEVEAYQLQAEKAKEDHEVALRRVADQAQRTNDTSNATTAPQRWSRTTWVGCVPSRMAHDRSLPEGITRRAQTLGE